MRFTPHQHLKHVTDFQRIRSSGVRREGGFFCINYQIIPDRSPALRRLGVIATRRFGNAVARNRAKRRLREAFRACQDRLPPSIDVVLIVRRGLPRASHEQLIGAMENAFDRITASRT